MVVKFQRVNLPAARHGPIEGDCRIDAAGKQNEGVFRHTGRISRKPPGRRRPRPGFCQEQLTLSWPFAKFRLVLRMYWFFLQLSSPKLPPRRFWLSTGNLGIESDTCESGGIGRRAGLRIQSRKGWGFNSPLSHQGLSGGAASRLSTYTMQRVVPEVVRNSEMGCYLDRTDCRRKPV